MPRRRARFKITAPVVFRWRDSCGSYGKGDGVTRDIGIGGMFIVTNGPFPPENVNIRCEALLPSSDPNHTKWKLRVAGRVQRASIQSDNNLIAGFAVRSRTFLLSREDAHKLHVSVN